MKSVLMAALVLLIVPMIANAQSLYGGESMSFPIARCDQLTVVVNASLGEWSAKGCNETSAGYFECNCPTVLNMTAATNALGAYDLNVTTYINGQVPVVQTVSTGGGYFNPSSCKLENYVCSQFQSCCAGLACKDNICIRNATVTTTTTTLPQTTTTIPVTTTTTTTTTIPEIQEYTTIDYIPIIAVIVMVIIIVLVIWYLFGMNTNNEDVITNG